MHVCVSMSVCMGVCVCIFVLTVLLCVCVYDTLAWGDYDLSLYQLDGPEDKAYFKDSFFIYAAKCVGNLPRESQ